MASYDERYSSIDSQKVSNTVVGPVRLVGGCRYHQRVTFDRPSRCSAKQLLAFRWYGFPTADANDDFDVATGAFVQALSNVTGRVWNPYNLAMVKSEFRKRLAAAREGRLVPVDQVKPVDIVNPPPLYEIRWQGVTVTNRDPTGNIRHDEVLVRLYHSEPEVLPLHFVGHHIHEKSIDGDAYSDQNAEIEIAKRFYDAGEPHNWGVIPS